MLEGRRLGLVSETMGVGRPIEPLQGSPAVKFVYHLIRSNQRIDQETLVEISSLPKRTVQAALASLIGDGHLSETRDIDDSRRKKYSVTP